MVRTGLRSDTDAGIVADTESVLKQSSAVTSYILTASLGGGRVSNMKWIKVATDPLGHNSALDRPSRLINQSNN